MKRKHAIWTGIVLDETYKVSISVDDFDNRHSAVEVFKNEKWVDVKNYARLSRILGKCLEDITKRVAP